MDGEEVPSELAEAEHELRQAGLTDQAETSTSH
jgi:hypothetical protein